MKEVPRVALFLKTVASRNIACSTYILSFLFLEKPAGTECFKKFPCDLRFRQLFRDTLYYDSCTTLTLPLIARNCCEGLSCKTQVRRSSGRSSIFSPSKQKKALVFVRACPDIYLSKKTCLYLLSQRIKMGGYPTLKMWWQIKYGKFLQNDYFFEHLTEYFYNKITRKIQEVWGRIM